MRPSTPPSFRLAAHETGATKGALVATGLVLVTPLMWAPTLGASARPFRILLGKAVYAVLRLFSENPVIEAGMKLMETLAAVVGFVASVSQFREVLGKRKRATGG